MITRIVTHSLSLYRLKQVRSTLTRTAATYALTGVLCIMNVWSAPHELPDSSNALDAQVANTLSLIAEGDLPQARVLARQTAKRFPDFALGQLISAELESTAAFNDVMASGADPMSQPLMALLLEAQARLPDTYNTFAPPLNDPSALPDNIIQFGAHVSQLVLVDLEQSMLYQVIGNDQASTLIQQHYIGAGKAGFGKQVEGDNKTPLGIYSITGLRSDSSLPDLYGSGALMLDYPNTLDRHLGRTGSGIWLHGVPHAQRSRSPISSEGCVTMSNDHLLRLKHQINPSRAMVVLGNNYRWVGQAARQERQLEFRQLFNQFQNGWASNNRTELMSLYADEQLLEQRFISNGGFQRRVITKTDTGSSSRANDNDKAKNASQRYLQELANIDAAHISITLNPLQPSLQPANTQPYLVMQARFGILNEHQITLYWGQQSNGTWRIEAEQWQGLDL